MDSIQPVQILLVEDDLGHARLIEKNLRRSNLCNELIHATNGQEAVDLLLGDGESNGKSLAAPGLILLDLNLPILDGYQVLERLKGDPRTRRLPIIILTTTADTREVARCYELGCNVYITKPVNYDQFSEAIRQLGLFLSVVTIPHAE